MTQRQRSHFTASPISSREPAVEPEPLKDHPEFRPGGLAESKPTSPKIRLSEEINAMARAGQAESRGAHNAEIAGSTPAPATKKPRKPRAKKVKAPLLMLPEHKETGLAIPAESLTKLRAINAERSNRSRGQDNPRRNQLTVEHTDPRTRRWQRDPGSMDVLGVDSPPNITQPTSRLSDRDKMRISQRANRISRGSLRISNRMPRLR